MQLYVTFGFASMTRERLAEAASDLAGLGATGNSADAIFTWLQTLAADTLVVLEAASGCDGALMDALAERGIAFARVNPLPKPASSPARSASSPGRTG